MSDAESQSGRTTAGRQRLGSELWAWFWSGPAAMLLLTAAVGLGFGYLYAGMMSGEIAHFPMICGALGLE